MEFELEVGAEVERDWDLSPFIWVTQFEVEELVEVDPLLKLVKPISKLLADVKLFCDSVGLLEIEEP